MMGVGGYEQNERSVALVFDYIPKIDRRADLAEKNFLLRRFAIALDSYRPFSQCMYFDHDLLQMILIKVLSQFDYDDISVTYNCHTTRVSSIECLPRFYDDGEQDSFDDLSLYKDKKMVLYIFLGGYTGIGGPYPYHDTFDFSFFSEEYDAAAVTEAMKGLEADGTLYIRDLIYGEPLPCRHRSFWDVVKRLFT